MAQEGGFCSRMQLGRAALRGGCLGNPLGLSFPICKLRGHLGLMPWGSLILCLCRCVDGKKAGLEA